MSPAYKFAMLAAWLEGYAEGHIDTYTPDMRSRDIVLRCMVHGQRQSDIARDYGLSRSRIHQILNMTLRKLVRLHKRGER